MNQDQTHEATAGYEHSRAWQSLYTAMCPLGTSSLPTSTLPTSSLPKTHEVILPPTICENKTDISDRPSTPVAPHTMGIAKPEKGNLE